MTRQREATTEEVSAAIVRVDDAIIAAEKAQAQTVTLNRADLTLAVRMLFTLMKRERARMGFK